MLWRGEENEKEYKKNCGNKILIAGPIILAEGNNFQMWGQAPWLLLVASRPQHTFSVINITFLVELKDMRMILLSAAPCI